MFSFYTKHPLSIQWWFLKLLAWATTPRTQGTRESTDFATNFQCVKYCKVPYSSSPVSPQKRSAKVFKNRLIPVSSWDFHGFSRLSTVHWGYTVDPAVAWGSPPVTKSRRPNNPWQWSVRKASPKWRPRQRLDCWLIGWILGLPAWRW